MLRPLLASSLLLAAALAGCAEDASPAPAAGACGEAQERPANATGNPTWCLETSQGTMRFELYLDKTPITAGNIVNLTGKGYFDGTKFHRVIAQFMNQGGDPNSKDDAMRARWGTGGPGYKIQDEFYCADGTVDPQMDDPQYPERPLRRAPYQACGGNLGLKHDAAGVLSMANSGPNSGGSQFFVTAVATPHLDGAHPVFGRAKDDATLDVVQKINRVPTDTADRPVNPVVLQRAVVLWS